MTVALVLHRAGGASVSTAFRRAAFGKDDPFARHREIAWEGPGSMSAGRTSFIGELEVASYPHIETLVVVGGRADPDGSRRGPAGASARRRAPSSDAAPRFASRPHPACGSCSARPPARSRPSAASFPLRADADFKPSATLPAECCWAPRRSAAATMSSSTTVRSTVPAPGTRPLPPHRSAASHERVHASPGRQRAVRRPGWQRAVDGHGRCAFRAPGCADRVGEQRSRGEVLRGAKALQA